MCKQFNAPLSLLALCLCLLLAHAEPVREKKLMLQDTQGYHPVLPGDSQRLTDPKLFGDSYGLQFSPDSKYLASCCVDSVLLWNVAGRKVERKLPGGALTLLFAPKGDVLLAGDIDRKIRLWNVADGKLLATLEGPDRPAYGISGLAFSPDGKTLASCNFALTLWDWETKKPTLVPLDVKDPVDDVARRVAFAPDGKHLASALGADRILIWNVAERKVVGECKWKKWGVALRMAYSPDGRTLATGDAGGYVRLWDPVKYMEVAAARATKDGIRGICYSSDGKYLVAAGNDGPGGPGYVTIWDLASGKHAAMPFAVQQKEVLSIALSPDDKWLAAGGVDKEIYLVDFQKIVGARQEGQK